MLPPEIILKIISLTGPSEFDSYSDASKNIRMCSQVCHSWRSLSIADPLLWGSCFSWLNLLSRKWTDELLRRSGFNSPLSVAFCLRNKLESENGATRHAGASRTNIELLSQRLGQIRDLEIRVDLGYELKDLEKSFFLFRGPAHSLSSFSLIVAAGRHISPYYFILDPGVFGGKDCPLKHLKLRNCGLDLKSPLYWQLTSLDIFCIGAGIVHDTRAPTVAEWLAVIDRCKCLVSLGLEGVMSCRKPTAELREVSHPSLAHLRLHLYFPDAVAFLSHLRMPLLRSFDVIVSGIIPKSDDFQTFSKILKYHVDTFLPTLKPSPWRITFLDNDSIRIMKEQRVADIIGRTTFSIQYAICPHSRLSEIPFAVSSLLSMLLSNGITQTEQLTIYIVHPTSPQTPPADHLLAALSPFASVTTLRLAYYIANTKFFSARNLYWRAKCPGPTEHILDYPNSLLATPPPLCLFPRLAHLVVQPLTPFDTLKTFIMQRKELGLPIQTVRFSDNDSDLFHELRSEEQLEQLRQLGPAISMDKEIEELLATPGAVI